MAKTGGYAKLFAAGTAVFLIGYCISSLFGVYMPRVDEVGKWVSAVGTVVFIIGLISLLQIKK